MSHAVIGTVFYPNSHDVVPSGLAKVDHLLVDEMLKFVVVSMVPSCRLIRILATILDIMTKDGGKSGECIGGVLISHTSIVPC